VLPKALQGAGELQQDRRHGQRNFFDVLARPSSPFGGEGGVRGNGPDAESPPSTDALPEVPEWPDSEKLRYEKEALDFYITSHPLTQYEDLLRRFSSHKIQQIAELEINQEVVIGGMITELRVQNTKKARNGNTRYARFRL